MTKQEAKECALRWMDEATVNGHAVRDSESADYRDRMDYLLGGVLTELAAIFPLTGAQEYVAVAGAETQVKLLPADFRRLSRIVRTYHGTRSEWSGYRCDGRRLELPADCPGTFTVYYERMPVLPAVSAAPDTVLDCAPGAETLIPLKLAADLAIGTPEHAQTGVYLTNRYHEAVQRLQVNHPAGSGIESVFRV